MAGLQRLLTPVQQRIPFFLGLAAVLQGKGQGKERQLAKYSLKVQERSRTSALDQHARGRSRNVQISFVVQHFHQSNWTCWRWDRSVGAAGRCFRACRRRRSYCTTINASCADSSLPPPLLVMILFRASFVFVPYPSLLPQRPSAQCIWVGASYQSMRMPQDGDGEGSCRRCVSCRRIAENGCC